MANQERDEGKEKPKPKKKLFIIIIGIIALLASAFGTYFYFIKGNSLSVKKAEPKLEVSTFELGGIIVNLADQGHYLRVSPVLEYNKDEKIAEELKSEKSQIIDQAITILRKKTVDNLSSADSVESIKAEILKSANKCLEKPEFKRLYFVEFLVQ